MKQEIKSKILIGILLSIVFVMIFILTWAATPGNYINKPFGICYENYTQNHGSFQSCGDLMSEGTARLGLLSIFIGLPVLTLLSFLIPQKNKEEGK